MRNGLALAAHMNVSTLSTVFVTELLASAKLPSLLALNSARLAEGYRLIISFFNCHDISYFPCNAGPVVLAKFVPNADTWDDEAAVVQILQQQGVLVGAGRRYHAHEKGWVRICFAVERRVLEEAIRRMEIAFTLLTENSKNDP